MEVSTLMSRSSEREQMRALTAAWTEAQPTVRLFIRSLVRDHQHVEDLTQEVAATVVDKWSEYDRQRSFEAWALGIARNKVMNYWTRQGRDRHVFDPGALDRLAEAHRRLQPESEQRREALDECLKKLSGRDHELIARHYQQSESPRSLAEQTGVTLNAIYIRLHRVRRTLLECIELTLGRRGNRP